MNKEFSWWQRPSLRRDEEEERERKATWLELFLDLVFVAAIAEIAHSLAMDISWGGVLKFCILFIPVWWIWIGSTFYNDRFETDDVSHRLFTFLKIIPIAALAYNASDGLGETSQGFALSYAAARIVLIAMWFRCGWHVAEAKPLTTRYVIGFSASVFFWLISIAVAPPLRFWLWGLGLLCDLVTPLTTMSIEAKMPRLTSSHLPERFGLLTIIMLGESVVGVVHGVAKSHNLTLITGTQSALGLMLAFSLWWVYFDHVISRRPKANIWWTLAWAYSHLILVMGLTAIGAGVLNIVSSKSAVPEDSVRWLICGAVSVTLTALGMLELTLAKESSVPVNIRRVEGLRFGTAIIAGLLGWAGGSLNSILLMSLLVALVAVQVVHGLRSQADY